LTDLCNKTSECNSTRYVVLTALHNEIKDILVVLNTASSVTKGCCAERAAAADDDDEEEVDEFGTKEIFVKEFKKRSVSGVVMPTLCAKVERRRNDSVEIFLLQSIVKI
jgi:hypothetical protein